MTYQATPHATKVVISLGCKYNVMGHENPLAVVDIAIYPTGRKYVVVLFNVLMCLLTLLFFQGYDQVCRVGGEGWGNQDPIPTQETCC